MQTEFMIRKFDALHDGPVMKEWFAKRNFPAPNADFLPETGVVISLGFKQIAMGFLFKTDGKVANVAHLISDPECDKGVRQKAVNELIGDLVNLSTIFGFKMVSFATNIEPLGKRFEDLGFIKTDTNVSHYRRDLCQ